MENEGGERDFNYFCSFLVSFSDLRKSDSRISSGLKAKLIYAWTPKSWSLDKLREVGVLSYLFYPLFKCFVNACVGLRP